MPTCLPVTALWWFPGPHADGPRHVAAPQGTPVHAAFGGRVTEVDAQAVGTVVVRDRDERFHHYRRLQASSITVREADEVRAGDLLGVIARPSDLSQSALLYGVQDADDVWVDVSLLLVAATDPSDLMISGATSTIAESAVPAPKPASVAAPEAAPVAARAPAPVAAPAPVVAPAPAVEPVPATDDPVTEPVQPRPDPEPAEPASVSGTTEDPEPPAEPAQPKRSRLAARRPPRKSS